ncbi:DUF599 domain-containing protein [Limimaricola hongkongensis]|uniref:DUF599 domain-containing protein n=1 Tax=Limimaricola hongkongensis DSM 17492 TaxID=1122180 RepID=A0A017H921_9RHOB|nr:DUF599 domain-containing protein [Limimaricola hongkongensis]EYD70623.1 hypothetical protein Lokhon_02263 [Limimaricola hongkongensis DSM 17492]
MDTLARLTLLTPYDAAALLLLVLGYWAIGWRIEHPGRRPSVTVLMAEYRRDWMREFVQRDPRIFDAQIVASLRQGTSFFASTCLLAVGGVLALIGNTEPLQGVAEGLGGGPIPALLWQIKLVPVALFLTHAFLKFVWAQRVFGYCSVMMAAVPNDPADPRALPRALQAAELNIRAAWNFNRGLRAMYFALGAVAWLLGPLGLIAATLAVLWLVWSREFASVPRAVLLDEG